MNGIFLIELMLKINVQLALGIAVVRISTDTGIINVTPGESLSSLDTAW